MQTHGSIGPSCSVADVGSNLTLIWSASQSTRWTQRQIAKMLDMKPEQVRIIYLEGAGCYGRNGHEDAAADAVMLSQAMGRPVRVQWMRQDEHGWDPKARSHVADLEGALDASGTVVAWSFVTWLPSRIGRTADVPLLAQSLVQGDAAVDLKDDRGAECIMACAKAAGWQTRLSPNNEAGTGDFVTGRGFSYVFYDNTRTYVSAVVEVEVNRKSGQVRATRFFVAHDCASSSIPME